MVDKVQQQKTSDLLRKRETKKNCVVHGCEKGKRHNPKGPKIWQGCFKEAEIFKAKDGVATEENLIVRKRPSKKEEPKKEKGFMRP